MSGFAPRREASTLVGVGSEVIGSKVVDKFLSPGTYAEFLGTERPHTQNTQVRSHTQGRPLTQGRPQTGRYVPSFTTIYDQGQNKMGSKQSLMNDHSFLGNDDNVRFEPLPDTGLDRNPSILKYMDAHAHSNSPMHNLNNCKRPPISPIKAFNMALPGMPKRKENSNSSKTSNSKRKNKQTDESIGDPQHLQMHESRKGSDNKTRIESFHFENLKTVRSGYTWSNSEISNRSVNKDDPEEDKTIQTESDSQTIQTEEYESVCASRMNEKEESKLVKSVSAQDVEYTGPLKMEELLGKGSEAPVYRVQLPNGEIAAVKKFLLMRSDEKSMIRFNKLKDEFLMLKNLNHSNIVRYLSLWHPAKQPFPNAIEFGILMEYMKGGPLDQYLDSEHSKISLLEKKSLIKQILQGLDFLHSHHIVHRDLKVMILYFSLFKLA